MNYLVSLNFANICFLGPHSAAEGPHLVPISLKIGSPLGPHFDKLGSQWHVATVKKHILWMIPWNMWTLNNLDPELLGLGTGTCELRNRGTIYTEKGTLRNE